MNEPYSKTYLDCQEKIRKDILDIVSGNLRWADPNDELNLRRAKEYNIKHFTLQSSEEVLRDIICDLTLLQDELRIESSFQSANI